MVIATHGRGMFAFDVRQLQQLTPQIADEPAHMFAAEDGLLPGAGRGRGDLQSAWVHYWLGYDADVSLDVRDAEGGPVSVLEANGSAGLHMVEWTLARMGEEPGGRGSGGRGGGSSRRRNLVEPGQYTAVLTVDGTAHAVPITVGRR